MYLNDVLKLHGYFGQKTSLTTETCNCTTSKQIQDEKVSQNKLSQNKESQIEISLIETTELEKNVPLYIITATYPRLEQLAELTRLGQTLRVKKIPNTGGPCYSQF